MIADSTVRIYWKTNEDLQPSLKEVSSLSEALRMRKNLLLLGYLVKIDVLQLGAEAVTVAETKGWN